MDEEIDIRNKNGRTFDNIHNVSNYINKYFQKVAVSNPQNCPINSLQDFAANIASNQLLAGTVLASYKKLTPVKLS